MIKTIVIPQNNQLQLTIPNSYIGKEIEVFLYAKEELEEEIQKVEDKPVKINNAARFRGILTSEEADQLQEYVKKSREEWDRDI